MLVCVAGRNPRVSGRAESFNTGVRTKPPLLSSDKMGRSYSMDKRQGIKSPLTPSREHSVRVQYLRARNLCSDCPILKLIDAFNSSQNYLSSDVLRDTLCKLYFTAFVC